MKTVSGIAKKDKLTGTGSNISALLPLGINGKSTEDLENTIKTLAIRKPLTQEQSDKNIVRNYEALPETDSRKQSMQDAYSTALENEISRFVEKNEGATRYDYLAEQRNAYNELLDFGRAAAKVNNGDHTALGEYNDSIDALMAKGYTKIDALNSKALADQLLAQERNKKIADFSNEHPVLGTLASFATNLMVPSEFIDNMIAKVEGRSEQHQNNRLASETTAALRSGASEDMGKTGKYLYDNVLLPLGDNATNILAGGGIGSKAAGAIGAAQMANAGYNQAKDNGASDNQALATAAAWAAAEYITEGISLGNLKSMKASGKTGLKNALKDIGKQMAVEGTEEAASEILGQVADYAINGDFSSYSLNYNNYLMQGMSRKEAKEATMKDVALQIGNSALGGAITGGIMGGGVSALNNIANAGKNGVQNVAENDSGLFAEPENKKVETSVGMQGNGQEKALNSQLPFVKEALQLPDVQAPSVTSKTRTTLPSNDGIPNSTEKVNASDENNVNNQMQTVSEQSVQQGDTVRGYNKTFTEKTDAPQELKDEFINNPRMYNRLHNADTKAKADAILQGNDTNTAVNEYYTLLNQKDPAAVPLGYNLSKQLLNEGRKNEAVRVIEEMSKALTESGQFSQAAAITMLNNDPDAAMIMLMRKVDSMNEAGREKFGKKWKNFELTAEEQQMFEGIEVGDAEAIEAAYQQVYDRISKEYPATMKDKLMEYRRVAMLLNVRTNVRNVVSNALMLPVRWTGDRVAALGEGAYKLIKPDYERTQSLNPFRDKQTREIATEAWNQVKDTILDDSNKYEDTKDAIRNKQTFKGNQKAFTIADNILNGALTIANKIIHTNFDTVSPKVSNSVVNVNKKMGKNISPSLLETARNFTYWLLEQGDNIFVRTNFKSRMMSYIDAQGITSVEDIPADAYVLATQEAMKATFKDDTRLSKVLSEIKKSTGIAGEVILPFTKTPANLAMRGIDYSPAGLAEAGYKLKNAKSHAEVAEAMTLFGQSATGSAAILLGMVLAESGLISGALSEDKDEAAFQKQQGMLPYAIKVGDNYYSYNWAQPAAIPLILGATIQQAQEDSDSFLHGLGQGAIAAADSWLELSPLQNLSDIFGGYGTPAQNVADVLMQFPLSFIPAQLGAATRIGDIAQRTTFDNTSSLENIKNQAMAKVPGLSELLPLSYDTWGNPINRQDSAGEAAFANLLNPGQLGNSNVTPLDGEVTRLFGATGDNRVFPKRADWSPDVSGEDVLLNNEQYSEYQRIMGENSYDMVSKLMKSSAYGSMDDTQRVAVIGNIYNFANALAKSEMLGYDIANVNNYKKAYKIYKEKGAEGVAQYYAFDSLLDSDSEGKDYYSIINQSQLSDEEKGYYMRCLDSANDKTKVDMVASDKGYNGVYTYYTIKNLRTGENTIETINAMDKLELSEDDKGYYIEKFVSSESEKPKQIYEVYGYSGLYNWYKLKIAADAFGNNNGKLDDKKSAFGKAVKSSNLPFVDQAVYMQIYGSK